MRIEILEFLYPFRAQGSVDVIPFIKEQFPDTTRLMARDILCELYDNKLIVGPEKNIIVASFMPRESLGLLMRDMPETVLNYKIGAPGIREYEEYRAKLELGKVNQSTTQANESTITTNKAIKDASEATTNLYTRTLYYYKQQKRATWVIAIATLINIAVSAVPYITNTYATKEQLQQLQTETRQLKEQLEKSQKKEFLLTPLKKDTFYMKMVRP